MILRRIEGKTLSDALGRAQQLCGKDALLVETRQERDGYVVLAAQQEAPRQRAAAAPVRHAFAKGLRPLAEAAQRFGLSDEVLATLEQTLRRTRVELARVGDPALPAIAARMLAASIPVADLVRHRVLALVGATGVGKTTTLAKLAAQAAARGERVVLVTLDTWRLAGIEQLRAFAELLAVPCEVGFTPLMLAQVLGKHRGADRILVDTSGRSPFDRPALEALRKTLEAHDVATALCVPAAARRLDALAALDAFAPLSPRAAILTKWDETRVPGESLSVLVERGLPLSHVTTGQGVPDDLLEAEPLALAAAAFALAEVPA